MAHNEPWQVFAENGEAIQGKSATREEFSENSSLVMAASHVWIWRKMGGAIEILLQKRAGDKMTWPSYYDVSAAGHIDESETPILSAIRESKEEIGVSLSSHKLYYIFAIRTPLDGRELDTVYLYRLIDDEIEFSFDDGEVEELVWKPLDEFEAMTHSPAEYNLVPQGREYFSLLIQSLRRIANENN